MKILVIPDIHGRTQWKKIVELEQPDFTIFLGDYCDSHEDITAEQQIDNLNDIIKFKEDNIDKVILLKGNHDNSLLGYYWGQCYPYNEKVREYMSQPDFKNKFNSLTQWVYVDRNLKTVFSHAGISSVWLDDVKNYIRQHNIIPEDQEFVLEDINKIKPCELFGFTGDRWDSTGESVTQPCTWIRPQTLATCNIKGWNQVVGHTPVYQIIDMFKNTKGQQDIWLCDNLQYNGYLVIEDEEFIPRQYIPEASDKESIN